MVGTGGMGRAGNWGAQVYRLEDALAPKPSLRPKMARAGRAQRSYPGYLLLAARETEVQRGRPSGQLGAVTPTLMRAAPTLLGGP